MPEIAFEKEMNEIQKILDRIEPKLKQAVKTKIERSKGRRDPFTRPAEQVMDRLVFLGAWIKDEMDGNDVPVDETGTCPKYKKSTKRRMRRILGYEN